MKSSIRLDNAVLKAAGKYGCSQIMEDFDQYQDS